MSEWKEQKSLVCQGSFSIEMLIQTYFLGCTLLYSGLWTTEILLSHCHPLGSVGTNMRPPGLNSQFFIWMDVATYMYL